MTPIPDRHEQIRIVHGDFIRAVVRACGNPDQRQELESLLAGAEQHGWGALVGTVRRIAAGERGSDLFAGLDEEDQVIRPAITAVREQGIAAIGPESADSLFARARRGEFDWVLALYHDQGLIAVKTASFGTATNWTLGLPFLRTSVDHGTAFGIAGQGVADERPLAQVIETTLKLISGRLPAIST